MLQKPTRVRDYSGEVIGSLTVTHYMGLDKQGARWKAECICGQTIEGNAAKWVAKGRRSTNPLVPSCGCQHVEQTIKRFTKHGYSQSKVTHPLYETYRNIIARCYNSNHPSYHAYGGRGVTICDEWRDNPAAFVEWGLANGYVRGLQIDKDYLSKQLGIDPPIYSPETCQWVSQQDNLKLRNFNQE